MDTFEDVAHFAPGSHVIVRLDHNAHIAGVVSSVDAERRELHFTNGVSVTFAPPDMPAEEPKEEEPHE